MTHFKQIPEAHLEPSVWNSVVILTGSSVVDQTDGIVQKLSRGVKLKWFHRVTQPVTNLVYNELFLGSAQLVKDTTF